MTEDNKYNLEDLITSSLDQRPIDFNDAFGNLMRDRIQIAVQNKKIDIAQKIYSNDNSVVNTEEEE
jgi:hypothetical protein